MIRTVIFDVGGTLVDAPDIFDELAKSLTSKNYINISNEIKNEFNAIYSSSVFLNVKTILRKSVEIIKNKYQLDKQINPEKIYEYIYLHKSRLFKGVFELLSFLKSKQVKLIILSDADSDVLIPELKKFNIYSYFNKIMISSDLKAYKPSEKLVKKVKKELLEFPEPMIMLGDSKVDIITAQKLGIASVLINNNNSISNDPKADYLISDLYEFKEIFHSL